MLKKYQKFIGTVIVATILIFALVYIVNNRRTIKWKGETFYVVDVSSDMQVMLLKNDLKKFNDTGAECFLSGQLTNFRKANSLKYEYQIKPKIKFYVLPVGEKYKQMTGLPFERGMGGGDLGQTALAVDNEWFFGSAPEGLKCDRLRIGLVHEHAHLVLNAFDKNNQNDAFDEAFAELITFYLVDMEGQDPRHIEIIKNIKSENIYTLEWSMNNCMHCVEKEISAQHRKTYVSMYLWALGYIKIIEDKYDLNKLDAFNFIMKKWGEMPKYESREEWLKMVSDLVGLPINEVLNKKTLQLAGQKYIQDNY